MKQNAIAGYTMEQASRIMWNAPIRTMVLDPQDADYPAFLELYRRYISGEHETLSLLSMAFSLGCALGTRDERARRNGKTVVPPGPDAINTALQAVKEAELARNLRHALRRLDVTDRNTALATAKAIASGMSDEDAIAAGNTIRVNAGRAPITLDELHAFETPACSI